MLFEDLHQAQPLMLELVQGLRDAKGILYILCAARYSLLDEHPDWGGGRRGDALNLYLEAMSPTRRSSRSARPAKARRGNDRLDRGTPGQPVLHHRDDRDAPAPGRRGAGLPSSAPCRRPCRP